MVFFIGQLDGTRGYEGNKVDHADYINPLDSFAKTAYIV